MIVYRPDINVIERGHHFLGQPDVLVSIYRLNATLAGGCNKCQIFGH